MHAGGHVELELTRSAVDRRLYTLDGVGTLRLDGLLMRSATAEAGTDTWRFARRGLWRRALEATDAAGAVAGTFEPRELRRGGTLTWHGVEYTMQPHSLFRERYALARGDTELALIEATGWWGWGARRPVKVSLDDPAVVPDPGLLLFAAFAVRTLADAAGESAAVTAAVTTTSTGLLSGSGFGCSAALPRDPNRIRGRADRGRAGVTTREREPDCGRSEPGRAVDDHDARADVGLRDLTQDRRVNAASEPPHEAGRCGLLRQRDSDKRAAMRDDGRRRSLGGRPIGVESAVATPATESAETRTAVAARAREGLRGSACTAVSFRVAAQQDACTSCGMHPGHDLGRSQGRPILVLHLEDAVERQIAHLGGEAHERSDVERRRVRAGRLPGSWVEKCTS